MEENGRQVNSLNFFSYFGCPISNPFNIKRVYSKVLVAFLGDVGACLMVLYMVVEVSVTVVEVVEEGVGRDEQFL